MRPKSSSAKKPAEQVVRDIRRAEWVEFGHCESSRPLDSSTLASRRGVMCNRYTATKSAAEVAALFRAQVP